MGYGAELYLLSRTQPLALLPHRLPHLLTHSYQRDEVTNRGYNLYNSFETQPPPLNAQSPQPLNPVLILHLSSSRA